MLATTTLPDGNQLTSRQQAALRVAIGTWIAMIALGLAWELILAPIAPGSWRLALKVIPLVVLLPPVVRGRVYGMQVALFVILLYVFEGSVRCFEPSPIRELAFVELVLAIGFFTAAIVYLRPFKQAARRRRSNEPD